MSQRRIRKPIILLGAGRSGTSLLGNFLASHPDIAYLGEPRPIWMYGNAYRPDHVLDASHLTPQIADYIDRHFWEFLDRSGRSRFAEKTPSNCLRIPFIHALYPDCRMVNVLRNGLEVVRSTVSIRQRPANPGTIRKRLRTTPWWEWPSYMPAFWSGYVRPRLLRRPARFWGARPPNWKEWRELPPHLSCAHQWKSLVEISLVEAARVPPENYLQIRYEDVVVDPAGICDGIADFAELPRSEEMRRAALERIKPGHAHRRMSELTPRQEEEVMEIIGPLQERLGYPSRPGVNR